jgi:hypothetical protein
MHNYKFITIITTKFIAAPTVDRPLAV